LTSKVERVLVVGRDAAAWITALGLQRAIGRTGARIEVLELPSLLQAADVYVAVPSLRALHKLLGLEESVVLGACAGVPMLAQRFSNWSRSRPPFMHGYDGPTPPSQAFGFLPYWLKAREEGLGVALEDFSLAAAGAKQGRVPMGDRSGPLSATVGYQLDARAYAHLLKVVALRSGVGHKIGNIAHIDHDEDRIGSLLMEGGERVEADLFIDASGAEGILIGSLRGGDFTSWREWLPCDRTLAISAPRLDPLPAFSQISAFRAGWIGLYPLQNRTAVTAVFDSRHSSDREVLESIPALSGLEIQGEAIVGSLESGVRPRPWIGNCIAIGEAAMSLEPLDAMQLHAVHIGLSHLVALFPVDAALAPEAEAYNGTIVRHANNIRDFQIAHYRLNRRHDEPLWDRAREAPGPDSLDARIALFESRGLVILHDGESFQEENWSSIFIGHGLSPRTHDPRVDMVPREDHFRKVQDRLREVAAEVMSMPSVETFLASHASPPASWPA
jgi:tryptophan halogenase